jgi:ribosomal protein S18 acetylase RimI-like enzyme
MTVPIGIASASAASLYERSSTSQSRITSWFQAPAFYDRHGFEVVATIDNHPLGYRNVLMRKRLEQDS